MEEYVENFSQPRVSLTQSLVDPVLVQGDIHLSDTYDQVKLIPPRMIFSDAFDGKHFTQSFKIINCGKYPAFVRIVSSSSQAIKLKFLKKGQYLPSGLGVTRIIRYKHTTAMAVNKACIFLYINEKPVTYNVEVQLIAAYIKVTPNILNFGELDVGNASPQLKLQLQNVGHRIAPFSIDLGRNELELIVDPTRGNIMPNETITIMVEVLGSHEGEFLKEFWIKTEPPKRVKLTGVFLTPKLVVEFPMPIYTFTMVDFPKTYYGAENSRSIVIRNQSSSDKMFCLTFECGRETQYLRNAKKCNDNLKYFHFNHLEGRMLARNVSMLTVTFAPQKFEYFKKQYCQAFIRVESVNYRDGIIEGRPAYSILESAPKLMGHRARLDFLDQKREDAVKTFSLSKSSSLEDILTATVPMDDFKDIQVTGVDLIRLCLYGEVEEAAVKICPKEFTLSYLEVKETYDRIVYIKNLSEHLPISMKSNKIAGILVTPAELFLGPTESTEVTISITPFTRGTRNYKIIFSLFHSEGQKKYTVGKVTLPIEYSANLAWKPVDPKFLMGITPKVTNEVGFLVDDIRYNTLVDMPRQAIVEKDYWKFNKFNEDLIAFPNDRPKCLRPWRNKTPCRTIFSNMPRIITHKDEYTLTEEESLLKKSNRKKYSDYISNAAQEKSVKRAAKSTKDDYDVTDGTHLLMEHVHLTLENAHRSHITYGRIPLPPEKLREVKIYPKYVYLGRIAPYTTCTDSFCIDNQNDFPINVSIKALSNSVVIKEKSRIVINAKSTKNIFFDCFSRGFGKFYVPVYIIINDHHIFDATVFAIVVPTTIVCDHKEIIINAKTHRSFFELFNPVNCDIDFFWEIQDENFKVVPESGIVKSRKNVYCSIMFLPQINATYRTEIYLHSASGAKQIITAVCMNERASVGFSSKNIHFENIPLNIKVQKNLVLRNFSDEEIMYVVKESNPMQEITVSPTSGKLNAKSDVDISITAHFVDVVSFNCNVTFHLQDYYCYTINISGNVVFPTVSIFPRSIQIPKVPLNCFQRHSIKIRNTSDAINVITFNMEDIPEFTVTNTRKEPINGFSLEPNELKEIILEFRTTEPIAYSLYFPYVMNNFIGPPVLNDPVTLRSKYYFKNDVSFATFDASFPKFIKTLNIRCASSGDWFRFSSLKITFHCEINAKCRKRFTITNVSKSEHSIIIPFIDKKSHFTVKLEKKRSDKAWRFTLGLEESVTLRINFQPSYFGNYTVEMPFYVDAYSKNLPFNCVILHGECPKPVITCNIKYLYFQSVMTKERVTKKITLYFDSHRKDCVIDVQLPHEAVSLKCLRRQERTDPGKVPENTFNSTVEYLIKFTPKHECIVHILIVFSCSCGTSYTIKMKACANNCIFSSYQSIIRKRAAKTGETIESPFPFYPLPKDDSYYGRTVRAIKNGIEGWLFSQGFFYKAFYKIPYGLARLPVEIQPTPSDGMSLRLHIPNGRKVDEVLTLPLVQLLINLISPNVTDYFYEGVSEQCFEGIEGVIYTHTVYKNILYFLEAQGVFLTQMRPEYMLPYNHYVMFMENLVSDPNEKKNMLSAQDFLSFTKQAWMDLMLRIYKVFVYDRATSNTEKTTKIPLIYEEECEDYYKKNCCKFVEDVIDIERRLLLWLEFHFHSQRSILWDEEMNKRLSNRRIRCFETDLVDSLPFVTVMVAYCPYMLPGFHYIFSRPQNEEDLYHNACIIYEIWMRLHLSYELQPIKIIKPSPTEMEFLISYMYSVLPNFYPTETITFNTSLGDQCKNKLIVRNPGDAVIAYTPLFFQNDTGAFSMDIDIIIIAPGSESSFTICYKAKSILKKTAVLLLSGETIGYKFAKTMAFNLIGIPNVCHSIADFTLTAEMFHPTKATINLISPFKLAYEAKIYYYTGNQTKSPETLDDFVSISVLKAQGMPRQMVLEPVCQFNDVGCCKLKINLCFVACGPYSFYFYFINKDVGDFCITINVKLTMKPSNAMHLSVPLPPLFSTDTCTCGVHTMDKRCPRVIPIELPSMNAQIVEGLGQMLRVNLGNETYNFWDTLFDTPKGFRVFNEYIDNTFEEFLVLFKNVLRLKVSYEIDTKLGKKVTLPKTVDIEDITACQSITVYAHWNSNERPSTMLLTMTASHGQEVRKYFLKFRNFKNKIITPPLEDGICLN